jgi:phosphatidylcholine synthase
MAAQLTSSGVSATAVADTSAPAPNRAAAWLVHFYTATGAVAAFLGTLAVLDGRYRTSFFWMVAATVVDATDGLFARRAQVKSAIPGFDGARLDDIVDYLTFVFLPVLLLHQAGLLPDRWGSAVACVVLLSSAYGFASADAKTSDDFFTGFPSYWNIVALYLFVAALPPAVNAAILLALSALVFVRVGYVYPSKTPVLQLPTILLGVVWGAMIVAIIAALPERRIDLLLISLVYPAYYTVLSLVLHRRRTAHARR